MRWLRNWTVSCLTKNLLKAVTIDEIIQVTSKEWLMNKRKLTREEILSIKEEAKSFEVSLFWKLCVKELKYKATLQRFDMATTADDMIFGKATLYAISQIEVFIKRIQQL